jgi:hypothetical protein
MLDIQENMTCINSGQIDQHDKGTQCIQCQDCIDYLNNVRLMNTPLHVGPDIEVNQRASMARLTKHVHEMNLQELFIYMKMLEGMAAQCSLIYNQHLVKSKIANPKEMEKRQLEWKEAEREQRLKNAPPIVKKQLTARDKAIKSLMDIGLSRSDAESSVDSKLTAQGKATENTYGTKAKV